MFEIRMHLTVDVITKNFVIVLNGRVFLSWGHKIMVHLIPDDILEFMKFNNGILKLIKYNKKLCQLVISC